MAAEELLFRKRALPLSLISGSSYQQAPDNITQYNTNSFAYIVLGLRLLYAISAVIPGFMRGVDHWMSFDIRMCGSSLHRSFTIEAFQVPLLF